MKDLRSMKILWTIDNICDYLDISRPLFYRLVERGLPAVILEGKWCAHAENLDEYFRKGTKNPPRDKSDTSL